MFDSKARKSFCRKIVRNLLLKLLQITLITRVEFCVVLAVVIVVLVHYSSVSCG